MRFSRASLRRASRVVQVDLTADARACETRPEHYHQLTLRSSPPYSAV
jgi:hypothetical protein